MVFTPLQSFEKYSIIRSPDVIQYNTTNVFIPVDLLNNDSIEITATFRFFGNTSRPMTRLWGIYGDYNYQAQNFGACNISTTFSNRTFESVNGSPLFMYDMSGEANILKFRMYSPIDIPSTDVEWTYDGTSLFHRFLSGGNSLRGRAVFSGSYSKRPREVIFYSSHSDLRFDVRYSVVNDSRI